MMNVSMNLTCGSREKNKFSNRVGETSAIHVKHNQNTVKIMKKTPYLLVILLLGINSNLVAADDSTSSVVSSLTQSNTFSQVNSDVVNISVSTFPSGRSVNTYLGRHHFCTVSAAYPPSDAIYYANYRLYPSSGPDTKGKRGWTFDNNVNGTSISNSHTHQVTCITF